MNCRTRAETRLLVMAQIILKLNSFLDIHNELHIFQWWSFLEQLTSTIHWRLCEKDCKSTANLTIFCWFILGSKEWTVGPRLTAAKKVRAPRKTIAITYFGDNLTQKLTTKNICATGKIWAVTKRCVSGDCHKMPCHAFQYSAAILSSLRVTEMSLVADHNATALFMHTLIYTLYVL